MNSSCTTVSSARIRILSAPPRSRLGDFITNIRAAIVSERNLAALNNKLVLTLSLALIASPACAEIYKWTDSNGNVHFSDKPHDGAEKVTLPPVQTYSAPPTPVEEKKESNENSKKETTENAVYHEFTIVQPTDQATIWNNSGNMSVVVQTDPPLRPGDMIQLLMDNEPVGDPQTSTTFDLTSLDRGSHTLVAKIINANGEVVATTDPLTVYMHKATVNRGG